jgi:hypothetical protein
VWCGNEDLGASVLVFSLSVLNGWMKTGGGERRTGLRGRAGGERMAHVGACPCEG